MNEHDLSIASNSLFTRKAEIEEEEQRKESLEAPPKPATAVEYDEGIQYALRKKEYDKRVANIDRKIQSLNTEIGRFEREIRQLIPAINIPIAVSGTYNDLEYNLIVTHTVLGSTDRVTVEEA